MAEQIIFDPSELAGSRDEIDVTPWLTQDGVDWGDASVDMSQAQGLRGGIPVDFTTPTRSITGGLQFKETVGGTTVSQARAAISSKIALWQREGGWVKRVTHAGGTVFAEVTNASFRATSNPGVFANRGLDIDASFSLEAIPEFYEAEVTDSDNSTTTDRELIFNSTGLSGDNPARVRLVVDNDGTTDWRGLIWAFRGRHFPTDGSHATTAKVAYGAEELQALDTATKVALSGAHGGTVVTHGTLSTNWTPVVGTNIGGTSYLTHTGTYNWWARVYSTSGTAVQYRAVYDVGDLVNPEENASARLPGASNYYIVNLGEVRIDPSSVGTHRWQGQIQAKGDVGGENFSVDRVWLQNTDEGAGVLSAPLADVVGAATYTATDSFNQSAGTLNAKVMPTGGTWATVAGTPGDFSVEATGHTVQRTVSTDTGAVNAGRFAIGGTTTLTNTTVRVDVKTSSVASGVFSGLIARYTDTSNFVLANFQYSSFGPSNVTFYKYVAGSPTLIGAGAMPLMSINTFYTFSLTVTSGGIVRFAVFPQGSNVALAVATTQDSALATGGALPSGRVGFWDFGSVSATRTYDNFAAWASTPDSVVFASRSGQLGSDAILRQDSGGTAYGPVSSVAGDLPRLPTSAGTVEALLLPSTGDFSKVPDTLGTASISARHYRRPSWAFVDDT